MDANNLSRRSSLWVYLALAWVVFAFGLYLSRCWVPLDRAAQWFDLSFLPQASGSLRLSRWAHLALGPVVGLLAVVALLDWGSRARRLLGLPALDPALGTALDFALGAGVLNLFWTGTLFSGLWRSPLAWLGAAAFLAPALVSMARGGWDGWRSRAVSLFSWRGHGWAGNLVFACGGAYLLFAFLHSVVPDLWWDSESYHLAFPSLWMHLGGLTFVPGHLFAQYPFGGELVFMNGFWFGSDEAAKAVNVAVLGAAGLAFYGWAREEAGPPSAALACGALWIFPVLSANVWNAQVEALLALLTVLFLYAAFRAMGEEGARGDAWVALACLLGALALSVKVLAALYLGAFALAWWWTLGRGRAREGAARVAWWGFLAVAVTLGPWMLRNAVWTGNPFAPYGTGLLGGDTLSPFGRVTLALEQQDFVSTNPLLFPFWAVIRMTRLEDIADLAGPLALAAIPLVFFLRAPSDRWRVVHRAWFLAFFIGTLFTHILRFHAPMMAVAFLMGPVFWARSGGKDGVLRAFALAAALSAVVVAPVLLLYSHRSYSPLGMWAGREGRDAYVARVQKDAYAPLAEAAARRTNPSERVMAVGDSRTLHYPRATFAQSVFDLQLPVAWLRGDPAPGALWRGFRRLGVDAVAVSDLEAAKQSYTYNLFPLTGDEWRRFDREMRGALDRVEGAPCGAFFRLRPAFDPAAAGKDGVREFQLLSPPGGEYLLGRAAEKPAETREALRELGRLFPGEAAWWRFLESLSSAGPPPRR